MCDSRCPNPLFGAPVVPGGGNGIFKKTADARLKHDGGKRLPRTVQTPSVHPVVAIDDKPAMHAGQNDNFTAREKGGGFAVRQLQLVHRLRS
jgi:hypothetical protein